MCLYAVIVCLVGRLGCSVRVIGLLKCACALFLVTLCLCWLVRCGCFRWLLCLDV